MSPPDHPRGEDPAPSQPLGWLFLHPDAVPPRWQPRAVPAVLVPLLPSETRQVLNGVPVASELDPTDARLGRLLADGMTIGAIAAELGMSSRGVQHRLARLRERLGVATTAELRSVLARGGF